MKNIFSQREWELYLLPVCIFFFSELFILPFFGSIIALYSNMNSQKIDISPETEKQIKEKIKRKKKN